MSSSFLESALESVWGRAIRVCGTAGLGLCPVVGFAADAYVIPQVAATTEYHTNRDLRPNDLDLDQSIEGYIASLGGIFGVRSQRGRTEARPRLQFEEYPDRDELKTTNAFFDVRSDYQWLKSQLNFIGRYSRVNEYNAEIANAGFDNFDPNNPVEDSTGRVQILSETISRIQLRPTYTYKFSPRFGAGVGVLYQTVNFDSDTGSARSDYDYKQALGFLTWTLDPRTDLKVGASRSRFETDDDSNTTNSTGLSVEVQRRWTETFTGIVNIQADRSEIETKTTAKETNDGWGFGIGAERANEVSKWRFLVGRTFTPSSGGARTELDNAQIQYDRDLTARWAIGSAARFFRTRAQGQEDTEDNRDFGRADIELRWRATQTWTIAAGYSYLWQRYEIDDDSGDDNVFMVRISYEGLAPQR